MRLLVFVFIKTWIKSVHQEGKRFSHNFIAHKFHLSYVHVFAKLFDEQIILLSFPWKFPHYYEVYEESDAKCSCGVQEVKLSLLTRRLSFHCELREFLWCKNICFQNGLDVSKQILEFYHYSLIDVRVSRNNCVDISPFFFLTGWLLFLS